MKYIIYISSAVTLMSHDELINILDTSRRNNASKDITGMLLYGEGTFVQVLEGEEDVLNETYKTIQKDSRHRSFIRIAGGELKERNFPEWSMGFRSVNNQELSQFDGFSDTRDESFLADNKPHPAITVLKTFVKNNQLNR